jgi:hypothetical protein
MSRGARITLERPVEHPLERLLRSRRIVSMAAGHLVPQAVRTERKTREPADRSRAGNAVDIQYQGILLARTSRTPVSSPLKISPTFIGDYGTVRPSVCCVSPTSCCANMVKGRHSSPSHVVIFLRYPGNCCVLCQSAPAVSNSRSLFNLISSIAIH